TVHPYRPVVVWLLVDQHRLLVMALIRQDVLAPPLQEEDALPRPRAGVGKRPAARPAADHNHVEIIRHSGSSMGRPATLGGGPVRASSDRSGRTGRRSVWYLGCPEERKYAASTAGPRGFWGGEEPRAPPTRHPGRAIKIKFIFIFCACFFPSLSGNLADS